MILLLFVIGWISGNIWSQYDMEGTTLQPTEISFQTDDGIQIIGDLVTSDKDKPIVLLFHQGGSNARAEYRTILPKLVAQRYNVLAIDQRVGGQIYGSYNRTLAQVHNYSFGDPYGYCDAYNNLEAALDYVSDQGFTGPKILWGSSYSASLAIQLAHNKPSEVDGVLAFSPASSKAMEGCIPTAYLETLKVPLLLLRPPNEMKSENVKAQFELAKSFNHQVYAPEYGVHGSSMLVAARVDGDVKKTWQVVWTFLEKFK